jgi:hypothetical protein
MRRDAACFLRAGASGKRDHLKEPDFDASERARHVLNDQLQMASPLDVSLFKGEIFEREADAGIAILGMVAGRRDIPKATSALIAYWFWQGFAIAAGDKRQAGDGREFGGC